MAGKRKSIKLIPGQINLEALIENRGQITIGYMAPFECVAIANDEHNTVASLVRQPNESIPELLQRLDMAIEAFYEYDQFIDEVKQAQQRVNQAVSTRYWSDAYAPGAPLGHGSGALVQR